MYQHLEKNEEQVAVRRLQVQRKEQSNNTGLNNNFSGSYEQVPMRLNNKINIIQMAKYAELENKCQVVFDKYDQIEELKTSDLLDDFFL